MENEFDYIAGLGSIEQFVGNIQLRREEHEHLARVCEMIRARLSSYSGATARISELESQIGDLKKKRKKARKRAAA